MPCMSQVGVLCKNHTGMRSKFVTRGREPVLECSQRNTSMQEHPVTVGCSASLVASGYEHKPQLPISVQPDIVSKHQLQDHLPNLRGSLKV